MELLGDEPTKKSMYISLKSKGKSLQVVESEEDTSKGDSEGWF